MPTLLSVLDIDPHQIGGQECFVRELSLQLARHGWQSVICFSSEPTESVREFLTLCNVRIDVLKSIGILSWDAVLGMRDLLHRYRPRILHLHFAGFLGPYPWMAHCLSVEKVFFTDHGSRPAGFVFGRASFWKRHLARIVNWPLTIVICVSDYGYKSLRSRDLLPSKRLTMIYNAVDLSRVRDEEDNGLAFRKKYGIPEDLPLVIQVSDLIPEKGTRTFLEAAKLVLEQGKNVHFALVGDGEYRDHFLQIAAGLGIQANVTWTGVVQDPLADGVYGACDVVCQVSNWEEAFGYVIAEAMASKKPVVATRVGGIPELVQDGETGFLITRGDAAQLADRILVLLRDRDLCERMGRAGRRVAEAKFNLTENVARLIQLYGLGIADSGHPQKVQMAA